jgi:hypothetical protein
VVREATYRLRSPINDDVTAVTTPNVVGLIYGMHVIGGEFPVHSILTEMFGEVSRKMIKFVLGSIKAPPGVTVPRTPGTGELARFNTRQR